MEEVGGRAVVPSPSEKAEEGGAALSYYSLFSGIEAASLAWSPLGWRPLAFSEIDPFCCKVLETRFPDVPNLGDVSTVDWDDCVDKYGKPDVIIGGSPCQSFSIAGKREGLSGASGLMWEYVRAIRRVLPRWVVWENVPGALSSAKGEDFRCLLASLDELGYGLAWRVLDAQFFGVAQRRRRLFLVGHHGQRPPVEVLFESRGLCWDFGSSREKRASLAARAGRGAEVAGLRFNQGAAGRGIGAADESSPCLLADTHSPAVYPINEQVALRSKRLGKGTGLGIGGPGDPAFTVLANHPHTLANCRKEEGSAEIPAEPWLMTDSQANAGIPRGLCGAMTAHMSHGEAPIAACHEPTGSPLKVGGSAPIVMADDNSNAAIDRDMTGSLKVGGSAFGFAQNSRDEVRVVGDGTYSGALSAFPGTKRTTFLCEEVGSEASSAAQIKEDGRGSTYVCRTAQTGSNGLGIGAMDVAPTLDTGAGPGVARTGQMRVRRLTPVECERLQGFPDDWAKIEWRGKPAEDCPDGPRYKAIGNSMAVPVMRWIGERLARTERG